MGSFFAGTYLFVVKVFYFPDFAVVDAVIETQFDKLSPSVLFIFPEELFAVVEILELLWSGLFFWVTHVLLSMWRPLLVGKKWLVSLPQWVCGVWKPCLESSLIFFHARGNFGGMLSRLRFRFRLWMMPNQLFGSRLWGIVSGSLEIVTIGRWSQSGCLQLSIMLLGFFAHFSCTESHS